tara:strand:- start:4761 stop:5639 length:879 start_codon:yes stop_codon:yes gene_type:complete
MPYRRLNDGPVSLCGLIGNPVSQSISPHIHNAAFRTKRLQYVYLSFKVEPKYLAAAVHGLKTLGVVGFNVTIPHKVTIIPVLDTLEGDAIEASAVNTVALRKGCLIGFNTDVEGFLSPLKRRHLNLKGLHSVVIGSGGAARACILGLTRASTRKISIVARNTNKAEKILSVLPSQSRVERIVVPLKGSEVRTTIRDADILVNATPVGMDPKQEIPVVDYGAISSNQVVYDLVYKPIKTLLLKRAESVGATVIPGYEMLVDQAAASFKIWTGLDAPRKTMIHQAISMLSSDNS